jgi:hypothetical protein
MIILEDAFPSDDPASVPLIGYDNQITNITATEFPSTGGATSSAATGFPVSNLLNSATHLVWQSSTVARQTLSLATADSCNYVAIAKHNFFDADIRIGLGTSANADASAGYLKILMHFEGTNGLADYFDTSGNDVQFESNSGQGLLTTAQFKFGTMSAAFTGAAGYIWTSGFLSFTFLTSAFTIDFWLRINATGTQYYLFDSGGSGSGMSIRKTAGNVIVFRTGGIDRITGTTALTTGQWYHIALARSGTSTKLFLNGTQEGSTYTDSNSYGANDITRLGRSETDTDPLVGWLDEFRVLSGKADFTANFTAPTSAYADGLTIIAGNYSTLLHFDGADASTTITDSGGADHIWTAVGNAQIDTAQSKFGGSSCLFDGVGDYLLGDGSDDFAMGSGPFTIDFWIRPSAVGVVQVLYDERPAATQGNHITIYVGATNTIRVARDGADRITSSSTISSGTWMHIAVTKSQGLNLRLFINGVQEGGDFSDANIDYTIQANRPVIGAEGNALGTNAFSGHIDEFRQIKGVALWTTRFAVPQRAAGTSATLGKTIAIEDSLPIIFRFADSSNPLSLQLTQGTEAAQIAVIYAGTMLVLERSVKVDVQHADITHARQSEVLGGMSESGNFLGRVLIREWRESQAEFAWFTPDWYRTNFEPFAASAMTEPFFWAWNPTEYPDDTAFAWLIEEIRPETDPATRRMAATISMRAIA